MKASNSTAEQTRGVGELAVDGLLTGLGAGMVMALYLTGAGLAGGESAAAMLGRFDPGGSGNVVAGGLAHLAISAVYGAVFGAARKVTHRLPAWLAGLGYGALLLGLANGILAAPVGTALRAIAPWHFLAAHLVYGLTLGLGLGRRR